MTLRSRIRRRRRAALAARYGIRNAKLAVQVQEQPGRPTLAHCLALLENESEGRNEYGHEGACPQLWGEHVTRANYQADYVPAREEGRGLNGVGPCQLTSLGYQQEADRMGGCWNARVNMALGFSILYQLIERYGPQGGAGAYNGSGPDGDYAHAFIARAWAWERRLAEAGLG